jgi:hypothetical protein
VADEEGDSTDMVRQLLGEGEGITHQTGNTLYMAVFLELYRSTPWACVSDDHGCCWPSSEG